MTIANSVLSVRDLRMTLNTETEIVGQATFNLDTNAYSINAEGKNIDLAYLSDSCAAKKAPALILRAGLI